MKAIIGFFAILIVIFGGFFVYRYVYVERQNNVGWIKIDSTPSAGVFIDNVTIGNTPYEARHEAGDFTIKLIPEGQVSGSSPWEGVITVNKNAFTYINRELGSSDETSAGHILTMTKMDKQPAKAGVGEIYIESDPPGALVSLDGDEKRATTPLLLTDVAEGHHELEVSMPTYFSRSFKVNVEAGHRVTARIALAVDQSQKRSKSEDATDSADLDDEDSDKDANDEGGATDEGVDVSDEDDSDATATDDEDTGNTGITISIDDTPTGWLRVRSLPSLNGVEVGRVDPGDEYDILDQDGGWYKIELSDGEEGWVSGDYVTEE